MVARDAWLVVIDPQVIFAEPSSAWASPMFPEAMANIARLAPAFDGRVLVTRWVPAEHKRGSWQAYFEAWPFADKPANDPLFDLVPEAAALTTHPTLDLPTFGKWGPEIEARIGIETRIVLTGVSTDCCVISTALAGADAGASITIVSDACAGSTEENHASALAVMSLYPPQLRVCTTDEALAE